MNKYTSFESKIVPLKAENVDTDQIIPARFLKVTDKLGLGDNLFSDWRYNADGSPKADFILNQSDMKGRQCCSPATTSAAAPAASMRRGRSPASASAR